MMSGVLVGLALKIKAISYNDYHDIISGWMRLGSAVTTILWFGFSWWRNNQSRFLMKSELAGITSIRFGDKAFQKASYAHLRWYRHT